MYTYIFIYIYILYIWCGKPPFANHFPLETHGFPFFVFCYDLEGITCFFTQFHMGLFEHWILQNPLVNHPEIPNKKLDHSYFIPISNMSCWFNDFPSYKPALIFMRYFPIWFPLFSYLPIVSDIFPVGFSYFPQKPPHVFPVFFLYSPHIFRIFPYFSHIFPIFPWDFLATKPWFTAAEGPPAGLVPPAAAPPHAAAPGWSLRDHWRRYSAPM